MLTRIIIISNTQHKGEAMVPVSKLNIRDQRPIDLLLSRRSVLANLMEGPGADDLRSILEAGMRVPDHGRLTPWRFVVIRGEARHALGEVIAKAFRRDHPDAEEKRVGLERGRLARAPVVVAVVSCVLKEHKIPEWEQVLSAGAACQNMLVGALSLGYAAQWLTEWYAYEPLLCEALGLGGDDRIAGFLYIGTAEAPGERARPAFKDVVSEWGAH